MNAKMCFILYILVPAAKSAVPGTFFWKPRLGLDLSIPTTEVHMAINKPTKETVAAGLVVAIDGYQAGITVIALAAGASSAKTYPHLDPGSAYFYTNTYRWLLRHLSLIPFWLGGNGGNYCDTHKVYRRRFYYMDQFMPKWLQSILFYVDKSEWEKEEKEFKKFKKYAEPAFGKHYKYPAKVFNNWKSLETAETVENLDVSSISI